MPVPVSAGDRLAAMQRISVSKSLRPDEYDSVAWHVLRRLELAVTGGHCVSQPAGGAGKVLPLNAGQGVCVLHGGRCLSAP